MADIYVAYESGDERTFASELEATEDILERHAMGDPVHEVINLETKKILGCTWHVTLEETSEDAYL